MHPARVLEMEKIGNYLWYYIISDSHFAHKNQLQLKRIYFHTKILKWFIAWCLNTLVFFLFIFAKLCVCVFIFFSVSNMENGLRWEIKSRKKRLKIRAGCNEHKLRNIWVGKKREKKMNRITASISRPTVVNAINNGKN